MKVKISCISIESCIQFIQMDKNSKEFHAFIPQCKKQNCHAFSKKKILMHSYMHSKQNQIINSHAFKHAFKSKTNHRLNFQIMVS